LNFRIGRKQPNYLSGHPNHVMNRTYTSVLLLVASLGVACGQPAPPVQPAELPRPPVLELTSRVRKVVDSARRQTQLTTSYDASYIRIAYPGGDVSTSTGVCSDVVIRAFRAAGVDLQKAVHEDMTAHFSAYPKRWGLARPDTNIDHRRVPNLMVFFDRARKAVPARTNPKDYLPGDVVAWDLGGGVLHIGVVTDEIDASTARYRVVHNIGWGARLEDVLFSWRVIGHYRYFE
jgi:uncharacterized protein